MAEQSNPKAESIRRSFLLLKDPRYYQITVLLSIICYGIFWAQFKVSALQITSILFSAQFFQWSAMKFLKIPFSFLSSLISSLSLVILLRTDSWFWLFTVVAIAIYSKFIIRFREKHMFNPTNIALALGMLLSDKVWVSPGQWGTEPFIFFFLMSMGGLVLYRSRTSDVTLSFLATFFVLIMGRAFYLGDPLAIPLHQISRAAFLLFAFYMISDPKTLPNQRTGRILFAISVALVCYIMQFHFFIPNAAIWALVICFPLVPIYDFFFPGPLYQWKPQPQPQPQGVFHEKNPNTRSNSGDVIPNHL